MLEGPPPAITRGHVSKRPDLETILEVASSKEREGSMGTCPPPPEHDMPNQAMNATIDGILEIDEQQARDMWNAVQKHTVENLSDGNISPPFSILDLDEPFNENALENAMQEGIPSFHSQTSKGLEPSYLGQYINRATTLCVPFIQRSRLHEFDVTNLQAFMSVRVTCTLPFMEWIKLKPQLWDQMGKCLVEQGILSTDLIAKPRTQDMGGRSITKATTVRVPLNKVGEVIKKDEGNTTLPIEVDSIMSMAILDSGASISIATKTIWKNGVSLWLGKLT